MTVTLDHTRKPDYPLRFTLVALVSFALGALAGDRVNDTAHRAATEQRIMETRAERALAELREYRADQDKEAPALAKASVRAHIKSHDDKRAAEAWIKWKEGGP